MSLPASSRCVAGVRRLHELLGHSSVETTMVYTRVVKAFESPPESPLDRLADRTPAQRTHSLDASGRRSNEAEVLPCSSETGCR
jgi:hypothetical protein